MTDTYLHSGVLDDCKYHVEGNLKLNIAINS